VKECLFEESESRSMMRLEKSINQMKVICERFIKLGSN
jgi:hypothetical protein